MVCLARFVHFMLNRLPLRVTFYLGKLVGWILHCNKKKRAVAFKNVKLAFPHMPTAAVTSLVRKSFRNFGLSITEAFVMPRLFPQVRFEGEENLPKDGGVLVGIHSGSWEVNHAFMAQQFPFAVLVREQTKHGLDALLNSWRQEQNLVTCYTLKNVVQRINQGYTIGMVVDHGAEENAVLVDFFSHRVPTPSGAVYLANKFKKKIYLCFGRRENEYSHCIHVSKPINPDGKSTEEILTQINTHYETLVTTYPDQYLWSYKRFKHKRDITVLILTDGKAGHQKQSLALLEILKEDHPLVKNTVVTVRYRNSFCRILADIAATFTPKCALGSNCWLRLLLEPETFTALDETYADIVISTGSVTAPINKLFSACIGARSVAILRANFPLTQFDCVIVPEHDRVQGKNITTIKGALTYPHHVEEKIKQCKRFFNVTDKKKIALFIGGSLGDTTQFLKNLKLFLKQVTNFATIHDYELFVSTSRRTPAAAEGYLKETLQALPNIAGLVIPTEQNYDFVFDGFVGLSDIAFSTSDSISMICEIAAAGKPCVCVSLETPLDKHNVFLESLREEVSTLWQPYEIDRLPLKQSNLFENNKRIAKEALNALV